MSKTNIQQPNFIWQGRYAMVICQNCTPLIRVLSCHYVAGLEFGRAQGAVVGKKADQVVITFCNFCMSCNSGELTYIESSLG